jgi:hypothetical protein
VTTVTVTSWRALGVVAEMLRADILLEYLTPPAQRLVADLLAGRKDEGRWYWVARDFLGKTDLGRNDQEVRTPLLAEYDISPTLTLEVRPHPLWSCSSPAEVRALPAAAVPHLTDRVRKTIAFNVIADLDDGTGNLIAFLDTFWTTSPGADRPTFGQLLDAYSAAS